MQSEISLAMRIATTLVLTPSYYQRRSTAATTLNVAGGMSGFVGALRARSRARRLHGAGRRDRGSAGQARRRRLQNRRARSTSVGSRWHITQNWFRLYACCNPVHPALDSLKAVLDKLKPKPEDIERVEVATYRFASVMRNPDPPNYFASKYSLPHVAAVMIVKGKAGHSEVDDAALHDPAVAALRHRVHMTEDPAMTAVAPRLRPARVTVTLKDGRQATRFAREPSRRFQRAVRATPSSREKFRELARRVLTPEGVLEVEQAVNRCDQSGELYASSLSLLRRHARPHSS